MRGSRIQTPGFLFFTGGDRNPQLADGRAVRTRFPSPSSSLTCSCAWTSRRPAGCSRRPRGHVAAEPHALPWAAWPRLQVLQGGETEGRGWQGKATCRRHTPPEKSPQPAWSPHTPPRPLLVHGARVKFTGRRGASSAFPSSGPCPGGFTSAWPPSPNRKFTEPLLLSP